jgi:tetratricopeptide (TPR) repeat protein
MALRIFAFVALLLIGGLPAQADWHEASSDHFLVYADQKEEQVQRFAERLERYHSAMQYALKRENRLPSPSNRVTVYVVQNQDEVRKLFGGDNRYIAGFYQPRAGGTFAIVPRIQTGGSEFDLSGERVLLHEYAHHIMYGTSAYSYPLWYSEGFAEFYGAAGFAKDGGVDIGRAAMHRVPELLRANNVPIELLLDTKAYLEKRNKSKGYDEFYGRSWLLFHYLMLSGNRPGQSNQYLTAIGQGMSELDAAKQAFGDLKILDKELDQYLKRGKITYKPLPASLLKTGDIRIRKLDAAEAAIMPVRIQSRRGVDEEGAAKLLPSARSVAAKFPNSPAVLAALSEAEFDAGNDDAAIKAAEAATALDPKNINALLQKGYALARKAESAADGKKAWSAVRKHFLKVNEIENDHPIPLVRYFDSFRQNGDVPSDNALDGFLWALQLAPFDKGLRVDLAEALINKGRYDDAIASLRPISTDAHNEELSILVKSMIDVAKTKKLEIAADAKTEAAPPAKAAPKK